MGRRPHIRRLGDIALPLDTPPEKAGEAVAIVRDLLEDHEGYDPAFPPRVYINEFNRYSLNLRFIYWYHPPNYWGFLAHSEKLNLEIVRRFAAAGIDFALPTTSARIAQQGDRPLEFRVVSDSEAARGGPDPRPGGGNP